MGYEERAPKKKEERDKNLQVRIRKFNRIEDLEKAHAKLEKAGCKNPLEEEGDSVEVWNCAARFALRFADHCQWSKKKIWSAYWRNHLGRKEGNTFLMECNPIPNYKHAVKSSLPKDYPPCQIWEERKKVLVKALKHLKPGFVIAYGKDTKEKVQELFGVGKKGWQKGRKGKHHFAFASTLGIHIAHIGFPGRPGFKQKDDIPFVVDELLERHRSESRRRRRG